MDKNIQQEVSAKKKKRALLVIVLITAVIISSSFLLKHFFSPELKKTHITTAVIKTGDIENTITASGEVIPEYEEILTSPIETKIQNVLVDVGRHVEPGQPVLELDKSAVNMQYEKLKFQFESKQNDIQKLRLELDKNFYDIQSNNNIKQLNINSLRTYVENARRLHKAGGGTKEEVEQSELNLKVAILEKEQLENEITTKQKTMRVQMNEAEIAAKIQKNDLMALEQKLQLAELMANRSGIVTWVNKNIGTNILPGQMLARIADLNSFKISGTISDNFIGQLYLGIPAIVRIGETRMRGKISNISPSVQNGVVLFDILLDHKKHKLFRANMKVEVFLVTDTRKNVLLVANGPAFNGAVTQDIFLIKNNVAIRKSIQVGLSNFDYVEVKGPVAEGDIVITSSMSDFKNTTEISIK